MNYKKFEELLMDYVEGRLDEPARIEVEEFLRSSEQAREDVSAVKVAFETLHTEPEPGVPNHYFNNFLPRLRNTLNKKESGSFRYIPQWMGRIVMPATALVVVVTIAGLYQMLQPSDSSKEMYSIVRDIDQSQYTDAVKDVALFSNDSPVIPDSDINQDLIGKEIFAAVYTDDNITTDRQILSQMDESDIEYALDQLTSVQ